MNTNRLWASGITQDQCIKLSKYERKATTYSRVLRVPKKRKLNGIVSKWHSPEAIRLQLMGL